MSSLGSRDRRAIRIGVAVLIAPLVLTLAVRPFGSALEVARDRLEAEASLYRREAALVESAVTMDSLWQTTATTLARVEGRLFSGEAQLAASELSAYAAEVARSSQLLLQTNEVIGAEPLDGGLVAYRVQLAGVGDIVSVVALLLRLETGARLVRVERLTLQRQDGPDLHDGGDGVQLISVEATVAGYGVPTSAPGRERAE
ncbi:MAG TPA: hypothetical protein VMM12_03475 [Longimicrobiales bacterium]|nr:hypothetical protein [Longimicrobiales bacterium]